MVIQCQGSQLFSQFLRSSSDSGSPWKSLWLGFQGVPIQAWPPWLCAKWPILHWASHVAGWHDDGFCPPDLAPPPLIPINATSFCRLSPATMPLKLPTPSHTNWFISISFWHSPGTLSLQSTWGLTLLAPLEAGQLVLPLAPGASGWGGIVVFTFNGGWWQMKILKVKVSYSSLSMNTYHITTVNAWEKWLKSYLPRSGCSNTSTFNAYQMALLCPSSSGRFGTSPTGLQRHQCLQNHPWL